MGLLDDNDGDGGITGDVLNMEPRVSIDHSDLNYDINRHAEDMLGPVTFTPRELADLDQKMNSGWWAQQKQQGTAPQPFIHAPINHEDAKFNADQEKERQDSAASSGNTLPPDLLNKSDQERNNEWWEQQRQSPRLASSHNSNPTSCHTPSTESVAANNPVLRTDKEGNLLDPEGAKQLFHGDDQALYRYLRETNPAYATNHYYTLWKDQPVVSVKGPVEGLAMALAHPGGVATKVAKGVGSFGFWHGAGMINDFLNRGGRNDK